MSIINQSENRFYPKNLFREEEALELNFISKNRIISCKYDVEGNFFVRTVPLAENVELNLNKVNVSKRSIELVIRLDGKDEFVFSSEDTNGAWKQKFYREIIDIYNMLIN